MQYLESIVPTMQQLASQSEYGSNRASPEDAMIDAENDFEAVMRWLNQYRDNAHTFRNYRKEAERLMLWCALQHKKPLSSLNMDDFALYFNFLKDPIPKQFWLTDRSYPRDHPAWRPFTGPLSERSVKNAILVIQSLISFLHDAGYLKRNPVTLLRRKHKQVGSEQLHHHLERILEAHEWHALLQTIDCMDDQTNLKHLKKTRIRFIFAFMLLTGVRTEEFCNLKWHQIKKRDGYWWLDIKGKRQKEAALPINDELLIEIQKYRTAVGLVPLPILNESLPILTILNGSKPISPKQLYNLIKSVGQQTIERLGLVGKEAEKFRQFSGHWIRHYLKSTMSRLDIPYDYQRHMMRHGDRSVTDLYQHGFKDKLVASANRITLQNHC